jgi:small-conductance mechanosensitive channel
MLKVSDRTLVSGFALSLLGALGASCPAAAQSPGAAAPHPAPAPSAAMNGARIIQVLDQTIDWYRVLGIQQQAASEPSEVLLLYDNRQTANQVLGLAFEIARANAELLARQPQSKDTGADSAPSRTLAQLHDKFAAQGTAVQAELESSRQLLVKARPEQRTQLQAKISELQGELELINARKNLLGTLATLAGQSVADGFSASALKAQIDAMAVIMPAAANSAPPTAASAVAASTGPAPAASAAAGSTPAAGSLAALSGSSGFAAARFGIWDLGANVVRFSQKLATIDAIDRRTVALQETFAQISAPLVSQLKAMSARGDELANRADTADSATLGQVRGQLDVLSSQFEQTSALLIPLSKEGVLLKQYRRTIGNWHDSVKSQYRDALGTLGIRIGVLAVLLALLFAAAEVWRRAVMRYIPDPRRRYQFLLLRRIALWTLVLVVIGFAFASELGSVVTFAGLITAGLAVAMQSVLVSIVGYFFLIGKYGIRVGDRVQIGEVTGEVIELGLVRLYLMELGGRGLLGPTGRVVAFANSIVFQVSSGLFKQIHGVNFVWREIVLSLPAGIDYAAAKETLLSAVTAAIKDYSDEIARQTLEIQRATASSSGVDAGPRVQLSFLNAGVEAHIRYPVHVQHAAEVDERVSQAVVGAISRLTQGMKPAVALKT